jgi:hypothetical protein
MIVFKTERKKSLINISTVIVAIRVFDDKRPVLKDRKREIQRNKSSFDEVFVELTE